MSVVDQRGYYWMLLPLLAMAFMYFGIVGGMVDDWLNDENYSHGFIIPGIAAYFLWRSRVELVSSPVAPSFWGLVLVMMGGAMYLAGTVVQEYFLMRTSLIVILAGCIWNLFGYQILRLAALPIAYLIFMVPLPYTVYNSLAFPLKLFVARVAVFLLKFSGLPVLREGNVIIFPNITLEVVEACSGMRSLVSLIAMGVAYAFLALRYPWQRVLLVLSTVPIAVGSNVLRVYGTGVLSRYYGAEAAEGFFHEFAGIAVFLVALAGLVVFGAVLRFVGGRFHAK
ncbi:exosortase/archaeosortase family protein [Desulfovibrio mangrovi]|uniref:exosortase A n=1 Tax=Desulfovibrio mangrovi TaxID=2976983 RepID=UPI00224595AC|nr:exosortase A [Desulfovibrio mangrovi]UZP67548.1 exosortase/archaeosortase family protein [Desulfovibrio mangrovi]